jgi:hypothetical protein
MIPMIAHSKLYNTFFLNLLWNIILTRGYGVTEKKEEYKKKKWKV